MTRFAATLVLAGVLALSMRLVAQTPVPAERLLDAVMALDYPKELLEVAQSMGVEFIPCQMTMDLFGIKPDDLIDGMGEPVGAATVLGLIQEGCTPLFI